MPRQSDLRFTFEPSASPAVFDVIEFNLEEGLSQPFCLTLKLSSHDPNVDFAGLLDNPALFTLWQGERPLRYVHGLISGFSVGQSGFRRTYYQATVEPQLARLDLSSNWRMFQNLSVPQILDQVLEQHHLFDREQLITAPHQPREYCVQAGETDLHFLARLAAEEGLLYTFDHRPDGHRLVYTDRAEGLGEIGPDEARSVLYLANPGGDPAQPVVKDFRYTEQVRTARQVQRDYTFTHPRYNQQHSVIGRDLQRQSGDYERYDFPGRYKRDAAGKPFTQTRLTALRHDVRVAEAIGDDARLQPGLGFDLIEHPREAFNAHWRTISLKHHGLQHTSQEEDGGEDNQGTRYTQTAQLIPGRIDWKARLLDKPRIDGPQMATVVGPPGEEIFCDEWGRVKISFPWDRDSQDNEHSSCWVRVSQGWAGTMWGAMAVPRIGQEVIVSYVDGDADQPIITGRTYRAANLPPYELPKHKTRMTIKSQTHKGQGFNELRFEDELGQEEVYLHAQRDQNIHVKHNESTFVGNDRREQVEHDEQINIGHNRSEQVGNDEHVSIGQDQRHEVGQDRFQTIGRNHDISIGKDRTESVGNHRTDKTLANHISEVGGHFEQTVQGHHRLHSGQAIERKTLSYQLHAGDDITIQGPGGTLRIDSSGITLEALAIRLKGPVEQIRVGGGSPLSMTSSVNAGQAMDRRCAMRPDGTCPRVPCPCTAGAA